MGLLKKIINRIYFFIYKLKKPKINVYEATLSGNGSFVDIRYWISRPDMINPKGETYLTDEETGIKLYLMKIAKFGAVRTQYNKRNNTGVLLFYNRNGLVKAGSKVSVCLDTLIADNIEIK